MKKYLSIFIFLALSVAAATLVACHDDDIDAPEPDPTPEVPESNDFNPLLQGIWMLTDEAEGNSADYTPVPLEEASLFVADPEGHEAVFLDFDEFIPYKMVLYADSSHLVSIEQTLFNNIAEALKKAGYGDIDYTNISAPEDDGIWFLEGDYKLLNDTTLILNFEHPDGIISGKFRRMTEVEADFETRGWLGDVWDMVSSAVVSAVDYGAQIWDEVWESSYHDFKADWDNTGGWKNETWMTSLPDSTMPVCKISIPGAHDACTGTITELGVRVNADCQVLTIPELLKAGVRYLDVRTRSSAYKVPDAIVVKVLDVVPDLVHSQVETLMHLEFPPVKDTIAWTFHGPIECQKSLESTFQDVIDFLDKNPKEFVIMRVCYESISMGFLGQTDDKKNSIRLYHETEQQHKDKILPYRPDMTLGEARGKILLVNDDEIGDDFATLRIGAYYHGVGDLQPHYGSYVDYSVKTEKDSTYYKFGWKVQNLYEMQWREKDKQNLKKKYIEQLAHDAMVDFRDHDTFTFDNQLNANTGKYLGLRCEYFANIFNQFTYNMLVDNMKSGDSPLVGGIYSFDYAGVENYDKFLKKSKTTAVYGQSVVWAIIERNFYGKTK